MDAFFGKEIVHMDIFCWQKSFAKRNLFVSRNGAPAWVPWFVQEEETA
jgi:hypothetical protein